MAIGHKQEHFLVDTKVNPRATDRRASLYSNNRTVPQARWDIGFLLTPKYIQIFLHNDCTATQIINVNASGNDGINLLDGNTDLPIIFPFNLTAGATQSIIFEITLEGPTKFDAVFDFFVTGGLPRQFRITGVRAPVITGTIGTLLNPHNWLNPLRQKLTWKTDILVAHDRTEQRMSLRVLPRREYTLETLGTKNARELFQAKFAGRKIDFYVVPTWSDVEQIAQSVAAGTNVIQVNFNPAHYDYFLEGWLLLFRDETTFDQRRVVGWTINSITVDLPFDHDYPAGSHVAPCRYYQITAPIDETAHTDQATTSKYSIQSINENFRRLLYSFELYHTAFIFPLMKEITFETPDGKIDRKWTILDNATSMSPIVVKDSIEPLYKRVVRVNCWSRDTINQLLQFLFIIKGQWKPFWILNPNTSLTLIGTTLVGNLVIFVKNINYLLSLDKCHARSHIRITYTDGTFVHRKITGVFINPLTPQQEDLTLDLPLPVETNQNNVAVIQWLEYVRLEHDTIELNWTTSGTLRTTLNVVTLSDFEF